MKAMLFAAGLGSRLKPITDDKPKALVEVAGQTLLERAIHLLAGQGVETIVINVHHHADKIVDFVRSHGYFGLDIRFSDERNELLETGGGLLKAREHFLGEDAVIVMNADILSNVNFTQMSEYHKRESALVTLAVRNRESSRKLLFDNNNQLCGRLNNGEYMGNENCINPKEYAFSGIQIINPEWFDLLKQRGKFSIIESYLDLCKDNKISAYLHDKDYWFDVGSLDKLKSAEQFFNSK